MKYSNYLFKSEKLIIKSEPVKVHLEGEEDNKSPH